MRGDIRRMFLAAAGLSLCAALIAVSCGPLGDDDDEPPVGESDNSEVVQSTYTPTVPGSTPEAVQTRDAAQTAAVMTATEQAINPPPATIIGGTQSPDDMPAPDGTSDGSQPAATTPPAPANPNPSGTQTTEDGLTPPVATLAAGSDTIDGSLAGYIWLFNDPLGTVGFFPSVPLMGITDVALTISAGAEAELSFSGESLIEPPTSVTLDLYGFDENTAIPQDVSGQIQGDGSLVFGPKTEPIASFELQDDSSFLADFAPGHYILFARADWPDPQALIDSPVPNSDVFVSYTFNIIVE